MKDEPQFSDRIVSGEEKIKFFHKIIESDKSDFPKMTKDDLIYYIICMDHFLQAKKELFIYECVMGRKDNRNEIKTNIEE